VFVTMNRIPVRPEYREAFEEAFRQRARLVDRAPGFLRNLVLRPKNPEDPYIVLTFWENAAALLTACSSCRKGRYGPLAARKRFYSPRCWSLSTAWPLPPWPKGRGPLCSFPP